MNRVVLFLFAVSFAGCLDAGTLEIDEDPARIVIDTSEPVDGQPGPSGSTPSSPDEDVPNDGQSSNDPVVPVSPECGAGQALCDGVCLDVTMDDANCGGCGNACGAGLICVGAECGCESGELCNGACVDTSVDQANCGTCGNVCSGGQVCDAGQCASLGEIDGVLVATNNARTQGANCGVYGQFGPTEPLDLDPNLVEAAQAHAVDMSQNNFFSHTGSDGSNFAERIRRTNFSGQPIGENIAAGQRSPESVVASWISSDGHCRNLMNPSATKLGVGYTTGGPYGTLWVQVFAR